MIRDAIQRLLDLTRTTTAHWIARDWLAASPVSPRQMAMPSTAAGYSGNPPFHVDEPEKSLRSVKTPRFAGLPIYLATKVDQSDEMKLKSKLASLKYQPIIIGYSMPFLTTGDSSGVTQKLAINRAETILGRHPDCEVVISEGAVSRRHAQIVQQNGHFLIEDLNSRNGTLLNNKMIHQATRLFDGDTIKICESLFVFHIDEVSGYERPRRTQVERSQDEASQSVLLEDDRDDNMSSIMSQIEVPSHHSSTTLTVSPEAKLSAMMNVTRALSKTVGLQQILPGVLDCLFDLFVQADRGFIALVDDSGDCTPKSMKIRNPQDDEKIRISKTIVNHVLATKKAIISSDAVSDQRFDMSQSVADFRIRSMMCAPLLDAEDNAIGVIQVDTLRRSLGFNQEDLEILATIAMQSSLAIGNAYLQQKEVEQRDFQRDLELAHEVQHGFLPRERPKFDDYVFYDYYRPAHQVGGDYYDYIVLDDERLAIIVADVVGHGIAAALLMAKFSAEVRFALAKGTSASEAVAELNEAIEGMSLDRFVTMSLTLLDTKNDELTLVNAGHMPSIFRRANGEIFQPGIEYSSVPIGVMDDAEFPELKVKLNAGDMVVMYTDGVNESMNKDSEIFGTERLLRHISANGVNDPAELGESIIRDVKRFIGDGEQLDDICLVCLGRK